MRYRAFALGSAGLSRYEACPGSTMFDAEVGEPPGPWIWWGIFVHRFLEYAKTRGRPYALAYIAHKYPRASKVCARIDVESIPAGETELNLAHDVIDNQVRKVRDFRKDPAQPGREVSGRADLRFVEDGMPHVVDYKTGEPWPEGGWPRESDQLLGLAAASVAGQPVPAGARASYVFVPSSGRLVWRTDPYSPQKLVAFSDRARRVQLRVNQDREDFQAGRVPAFVRGPHCSWCGLKPVCPAHL